MTTGILAKLPLTSWDQASAWVKNRHYPCEHCVEYKAVGKCRFYALCKEDGKLLGAVFFTRKVKEKAAKPYRPDPTRGSVQG